MKTTIAIIGLVIAVLVGTYFGVKDNTSPKIFGNAEAGNQSTTTSTFGAVTAGTSRSLKTIQGVLHNVIITNESAGTIVLKNATSSTDISSSTIIVISPSMIEGSHAIDVFFDRGLFIDFPSTNVGSSTITWD